MLRNNWFTRLVLKTTAIFLLIALVFMPLTSSLNSDIEVSEGNIFTTGALDFTVSSDTGNFVPDPDQMGPGDTVTRNVTVTNVTSGALQYRGEYEYVSGDTDLCQAFNLEVTLDGNPVYDDPLYQFSAFASPLLLGSYEIDQLVFNITLPLDADPPSLSLDTCSFNLNFIGWQQGILETDPGFKDTETLGGNSLGTIDFASPATPTGVTIYKGHNPATRVLVGCGGYTNDTHITIDWLPNTEPDIAYYWFGTKFNPHHAKVYHPTTEYLGNMTPGNNPYYYTVSAVDTAGNESAPTEKCYLTLDQSEPVTTLVTLNSPERTIKEDVLNGDFNDGGDGLDHWVKTGEVSVVHQEGFDTNLPPDGVADLIINPHDIPESGDNQHMVVVKPSTVLSGADPYDGGDLYYSSISQSIPNSAKTLSFWFNFLTEDSTGYDNPGLSIFINNKEIYQLWAEDINDIYGNLTSSGWKKFYADLSGIDKTANPILTLIFFSGNKYDQILDSWVYLDKISTADIVVSPATKLYLSAVDQYSDPTIHYKLGNCSSGLSELTYTYGSYPSGEGLVLSGPTLNNKFCYWSEDEAENEETKHELNLVFDSVAPLAITDLSLRDLGGSVILDWTAPTDDNNDGWVSEYDVRYSTATISASTTWNSLLKVNNLRAPRKPGEAETITVNGLTIGVPYWFAVKSADAGPSWSQMSNVVTNGPLVVLNEIMYNPVGDENGSMPNGEWVELYNNADYDIDAVGWVIKDTVGYIPSHDIIISTANSDNNLNTSDGGETIVPRHGWLTVYRNGSAIFNNGGDTVSLYNGSHLIDSYTYTGSKSDGLTAARVSDGIGNWVDPLATPGRKNVLSQADLDPQIRIWQQDNNNAKIGIFDSVNYNNAEYKIIYSHQETGMVEPQEEMISGSVGITSQEVIVSDKYFGTCSSTCTPHHNITNVSLEVVLKGSGISDRTLTDNLDGNWTQ